MLAEHIFGKKFISLHATSTSNHFISGTWKEVNSPWSVDIFLFWTLLERLTSNRTDPTAGESWYLHYGVILPRWYLLHWVSLFLNLQVQFVDDLYLTCCVILWSLWPITFQFSHMFRGLFGSEALAFRKYFHPEFPALHSTMGWRFRPLFTDFFKKANLPIRFLSRKFCWIIFMLRGLAISDYYYYSSGWFSTFAVANKCIGMSFTYFPNFHRNHLFFPVTRTASKNLVSSYIALVVRRHKGSFPQSNLKCPQSLDSCIVR